MCGSVAHRFCVFVASADMSDRAHAHAVMCGVFEELVDSVIHSAEFSHVLDDMAAEPVPFYRQFDAVSTATPEERVRAEKECCVCVVWGHRGELCVVFVANVSFDRF